MGLPISKIIVATNENDILSRFFATGTFERGKVVQTVSPSIDIQVPYNFERFLYFVTDGDTQQVKKWMHLFEDTGRIDLPKLYFEKTSQDFLSIPVSSQETLDTIARYHRDFNYIVCPHTAVGIRAAEILLNRVISY